MSEPSSSRDNRRRRQSTDESTFPTTRRVARTHAKQRVRVVSGADPLPEGQNIHEEWNNWSSVEDDGFHQIQRVHSTALATEYRFAGSPKHPAMFYKRLMNARVKECIESTNWHHVCSVAQLKNDQQCVLALIERWWDTTHTFHLPFVELGFTPYDFTCITGIPIGNGKRLPPFSRGDWNTLEKMQAFFPHMTGADVVDTSGPKCVFLKRILDTLELPVCNNSSAVPTAAEKSIETMWLRAFFLLVLGEIFFPVSKKWVSAGWFSAVQHPYAVGSFDWGIPILCQMYSGLDESCRGKVKCAQFFWTVLQVS